MKQELLKWIDENKVGRPSVFGLGTVETVYMDDLIEMINELEEPQVTNEQAWNKIAEVYPETAQNLRITLDHAVYGHEAEPQKVKVKQFVADWFEKNNINLDLSIIHLTKRLHSKVVNAMALNEFEKWFNCSSNEPIKTLVRMLDGYEVEEEPKYSVIVAGKYLIKMFHGRKDHKFVSQAELESWHSSAYKLTQKEIKEIDERYWPFAVPVEKV